jgi:hypothetical protein
VRLGLVSNARSERNKRGVADIERQLAALGDLRHVMFDGSRPMGDLLRELAGDGVELLGINGGDGTVQGALTALLEERPFAQTPPVAILPRGMANMTAADVGLRGRNAQALRRLVVAADAGRIDTHLVERQVLRVDGIRGWPAQRGMFLGAAAAYEAIQICKAQIHTLGLKGEVSHAATLAWLLLNAAIRGLEAVGMHGHDIRIAIDNRPPAAGRCLLLVATTLDRMVLGSRPFWNTRGRPLRLTTIAYPAPGLARHAWRALYGTDQRELPENVFFSTGADRVGLELDGPFTIDGQFFEPEPGRALEITAADRVRFVRL